MTIMELLIVVVLLGLLGSFVVGGFSNVGPAGEEIAAVHKARTVNAARITYSLTVPAAATQWAGCTTDLEKTTLLVNAAVLNGVATDWLTSRGGYTLSLSGALRAKTVLRNRAGTALNYPD